MKILSAAIASVVSLTLVGVSEAQVPLDLALRLCGEWRNVEQETRSTTRLVISAKYGKGTIHGWGACTPTDCDWGEVPLELLAYRAADHTQTVYGYATWNPKFKEHHVVVHCQGDQLVVESYNIYRDDSGRTNLRLVERFKRSE